MSRSPRATATDEPPMPARSTGAGRLPTWPTRPPCPVAGRRSGRGHDRRDRAIAPLSHHQRIADHDLHRAASRPSQRAPARPTPGRAPPGRRRVRRRRCRTGRTGRCRGGPGHEGDHGQDRAAWTQRGDRHGCGSTSQRGPAKGLRPGPASLSRIVQIFPCQKCYPRRRRVVPVVPDRQPAGRDGRVPAAVRRHTPAAVPDQILPSAGKPSPGMTRPDTPGLQDSAAVVVGYLNFSSGAFDPAAWQAMSDLYAASSRRLPIGLVGGAARRGRRGRRSAAMSGWRELEANQPAFRDARQARRMLGLSSSGCSRPIGSFMPTCSSTSQPAGSSGRSS